MKNDQIEREMSIVAINTVDYGSTGRIMKDIAGFARKKGYRYQTFSMAKRDGSKPTEGHTYYVSYFGYMLHYALGRITGLNGFFSVIPTIRLVHTMKKLNPDIIHLHNLHGFCINIPILFSYLKRYGIPTVLTMHDCWLFTGHCAHFDMIGCTKWRIGCFECPIYKEYPESCVDNSKWMWKYKKRQFNNISNLVIVTPSHWLAKQVQQSFLRENGVRVIHNGINMNIFKPTESNFRSKYGLDGKYIVLGVAFGWGKKKGLDVFQRLAAQLPEEYAIVLVGTTEQIDNSIDSRIISIHKTNDQHELVGIYSTADVFVNPTREDTFPTVNIEALACGTPIVTFNTGGSPEIINNNCGLVIDKNDYSSLMSAVIYVCENHPYNEYNCVRRAHEFSKDACYSKYLELYEKIFTGDEEE